MINLAMTHRYRLSLLAMQIAAAAFAANPDPRQAQDEASQIARYYEGFAAKTLARYYEESTFLVKAKVEMGRPAAEPDFSLAPGEAEEDLPPQLPGLPFLPETMEEAPAEAAKALPLVPQSVTLDVLVDTSYSERDLEFVRNLLAMASHLDESRGDAIQVHEGVFPRDNRSLTSYRKPMEDAPPQVKARGDTAASRPPEASPPAGSADKEKAAANPFSAYLDHLPSLIPLLVICLLILACVWMVSRAIAGSRKDRRPGFEAMPSAVPPPLPAAPAAPASIAAKSPQAGPGAKLPPELAGYRPYLLNCFVGNPKHCGQIIKSWIQRDSEKGLRDAAALVGSLDPRLTGVLGGEIGRDMALKLETHLQAGEAPTDDELLVLYKEFKREFQNLSNGSLDDDHHKDLFGFLQQLNEQQIMHILKDESVGIAGLVLAQLPPEMAGGILQKVEPDNRSKLLISMGNIDNIPLNVYRELADRLSLKAMDVSNMRYVAADGVDTILDLIDNLPLNLQFNYIHSISEMDLGLAEKIRNRYVTLPEVATLPDKFLSKVIQNLDPDTLILALLHADEAIQHKVASILPDRMRQMVASGMESSRETTPKESESAQRRLLHKIRDEIRLSGRPA